VKFKYLFIIQGQYLNSISRKPTDTSSANLLNHFSLLRGVDLIFWSLLIFYGLILVTMQDVYILSFPYLMVLPLGSLVLGTLKLPDGFSQSEDWPKALNRLRIFSLIGAFTFPFVIFVQLSEKNTYFALCCGLGIFAIMQILIGTAQLCRIVSLSLNEQTLAAEGKLAAKLIYLFAIIMVIVMMLYINDSSLIRTLHDRGLLDAAFKVLVLFLVFPLIFPITLLFRLKFALFKMYKQKVRSTHE
jgi:hypothetical protein